MSVFLWGLRASFSTQTDRFWSGVYSPSLAPLDWKGPKSSVSSPTLVCLPRRRRLANIISVNSVEVWLLYKWARSEYNASFDMPVVDGKFKAANVPVPPQWKHFKIRLTTRKIRQQHRLKVTKIKWQQCKRKSTFWGTKFTECTGQTESRGS